MRALLVLSFLLVLAACAAPEKADRLTLTPARFDQLAGWQADQQAASVAALLKSCPVLSKNERAATSLTGTAADWQALCAEAATLPPQDDQAARTFFETWFRPWQAANNGKSAGLFTGYYVPDLRGSRTQHGSYQHPVHGRPQDLVTVDLGDFDAAWKGKRLTGRVQKGRLKPYPVRADIVRAGLPAEDVLVWVDDAVDAFFLEIQGSGRVTLEDGSIMRLGYAAQNGHGYVPVGRALLDRGELERGKVSMPTIRAWLAAHPERRQEIMNLNPSYVFFKIQQGEDAVGAQGVALTAGRSLAVDRRFVSYGLPVWLDAAYPGQEARRLQRLLVAQDTGGAIKGPVRGDVFWGYDAPAAELAGIMQSTGVYYLLLPKTVTPAELVVTAQTE